MLTATLDTLLGQGVERPTPCSDSPANVTVLPVVHTPAGADTPIVVTVLATGVKKDTVVLQELQGGRAVSAKTADEQFPDDPNMSVSLQSNTTICVQGPGGTFQLSTFEVAWRQLLTVGPPARLYGAFVVNASDASKAGSKLVVQSKQQMYYVPGPTSSLAVMLKHGMSGNSKEKNCRSVLAWALRGDLFAPTGLLLVTQKPVQPGLLLKL
jgi:hypothetical protein